MSIKAFYQGLANLEVAGVKKRLPVPPMSLSSADLPAQWVQFPQVEAGALTFQQGATWPLMRAELVIAILPVGRERAEVPYAKVLDFMEALSVALQGADVCRGPIFYVLRPDIVNVAGNDYWAVIAEVEGRG